MFPLHKLFYKHHICIQIIRILTYIVWSSRWCNLALKKWMTFSKPTCIFYTQSVINLCLFVPDTLTPWIMPSLPPTKKPVTFIPVTTYHLNIRKQNMSKHFFILSWTLTLQIFHPLMYCMHAWLSVDATFHTDILTISQEKNTACSARETETVNAFSQNRSIIFIWFPPIFSTRVYEYQCQKELPTIYKFSLPVFFFPLLPGRYTSVISFYLLPSKRLFFQVN